ncbi:MAG: hypothetical protein N2654_03550 [Deltaproteobacteria bacterium]|nr:hypothetical protein [Deltaproteobacteria bacterium]
MRRVVLKTLVIGGLILGIQTGEAQRARPFRYEMELKKLMTKFLALEERVTRLENCDPSADVNGDGIVADDDLLIVLFNFGKKNAKRSDGDVTCDGLVNDLDLRKVLTLFGTKSKR